MVATMGKIAGLDGSALSQGGGGNDAIAVINQQWTICCHFSDSELVESKGKYICNIYKYFSRFKNLIDKSDGNIIINIKIKLFN